MKEISRMKSEVLSRLIHACTLGSVKYGWWTSSYRSDSAPIVLGGCSRSGTTLLRELLSAHSAICIGPETALFLGIKRIDHVARVTGLDDKVLRTYFRRSTCLAEFAELVLSHFMKDAGKNRWGEKTPANVRHLRTIFRFFPNARFIHIIRDGRDVVCSLRTHPRYEWRNGQHVETNTVRPWRDCVNEWVHDVQLGLEWQQDPRYYEVRYEQLVEDPEATMKRLISWLGEQWDPGILTAYKTDRHVNHPGLSMSIYTSASARWLTDLPPAGRTEFQEKGNQLLWSLGYTAGDAWVEHSPQTPDTLPIREA